MAVAVGGSDSSPTYFGEIRQIWPSISGRLTEVTKLGKYCRYGRWPFPATA